MTDQNPDQKNQGNDTTPTQHDVDTVAQNTPEQPASEGSIPPPPAPPEGYTQTVPQQPAGYPNTSSGYPQQPAGYQQPNYQQQAGYQQQPPDSQQPPYNQQQPGYQQQPYYQQPNYQQQGYQPQPGYQQPYQQQQPPHYQQQAGYQQPYPYQAYPPAQPPAKNKTWLWVLLGILLVLILGFGGCVGCAVFSTLMDDSPVAGNSSGNSSGGYSYDYDYSDDYSSGYTRDDILAWKEAYSNTITDGKCSDGVYEVGADGDIAAGTYFIEGSQSTEGFYSVYAKGDSDDYDIDQSVVYFGNYYVDLEEGDIIVFEPSASETMYTTDLMTQTFQEPYLSGLYRVGTDIPAGTYTIAYQAQAAENASMEAAAFIMSDLDWTADSITDTFYVLSGTPRTITVEDGDWLELYAVTTTAQSA